MTTTNNWNDDERYVGDVVMTRERRDWFDMKDLCKELIIEEENISRNDYYNSYDYEYNCEYYDCGRMRIEDTILEECEDNVEDNDDVQENEENENIYEEDNEKNEYLMNQSQYMYT